MPQVHHSFQIDQPVASLWSVIQDVPALAQCMPGVESLEPLGNNEYKGMLAVKLGPIAAEFEGQGRLLEIDEDSKMARLEARGVDKRGGGRASARITYILTAVGSGTKVAVTADISLQGPMAQFGRTGLLQEVSDRLMLEFVDCLRRRMAAKTPDEAAEIRSEGIHGLGLLLHSLWGWIRRVFSSGRSNDGADERGRD
jgi:carbon monoxide dehydrogenase subunit G